MLFTLFRKQVQATGLLGICLCPGGIALAHAVPPGTGSSSSDPGMPLPRLAHCEFQPLGEGDDPQLVLRSRLQQLKFTQIPVATALASNDYHLQMLPAPQVEAQELHQAMRWQMKDRIDFDIGDAVIDVFEVPGQKERGRVPQIYVVAARRQPVQRLIDVFEGADAKLEYIDIPELAQRNIAAQLPGDQTGVALLVLGEFSGTLTLTRQGVLYLARELEQGGVALQPEPVRSGGGLALAGDHAARQHALDAVVLELQRSLDYYESHFAQAPITRLVIAPQMTLDAEVPDALSQMLGLPVELLDLNQLLQLDPPLSLTVQAACLTAMGLALRGNPLATPSKEGAHAAG